MAKSAAAGAPMDITTVWEAAMSASKWGLDNLTAVLDRNNLQNDLPVDEVMPIEPVVDKWQAFGWHVLDIDGHDRAGWHVVGFDEETYKKVFG